MLTFREQRVDLENKGSEYQVIATEANAVRVRWRIIVSYESKMYSGKGISSQNFEAA